MLPNQLHAISTSRTTLPISVDNPICGLSLHRKNKESRKTREQKNIFQYGNSKP